MTKVRECAKGRKCSVVDCEDAVLAKGMCRLHYNRVRLTGVATITKAKARRIRHLPLEERCEAFWKMLDRSGGSDACWPMQGRKPLWNGYFTVRFWDDKTEPAHRIAFEIANGRIDESSGRMVVLHECDNRACSNPKHLKVGTYSDNTKDMFAKGRARDRHETLRKLSFVQAQAMRTEFSAGGVTQNDLAEKYGIAAQNVSLILTGKTYTTEISHSRLTSADDIAIRGMISNGARHEDAAIAFGVSIAAIGRSLKRSARTTQAA